MKDLKEHKQLQRLRIGHTQLTDAAAGQRAAAGAPGCGAFCAAGAPTSAAICQPPPNDL